MITRLNILASSLAASRHPQGRRRGKKKKSLRSSHQFPGGTIDKGDFPLNRLLPDVSQRGEKSSRTESIRLLWLVNTQRAVLGDAEKRERKKRS